MDGSTTRIAQSCAASIGLLALAIAARAQSLPEAEPGASRATWQAFRPVVIASGDGDPVRAVSYCRAVDQLLRKIDSNFVRDTSIANLQDRVSASYRELNFRSLFELLPDRSGPWHLFEFQGAPTSNGYRLFAGRTREGVQPAFGEASSSLRMRRIEARDDVHYALQSRAQLGVGPLSWRSIQQAMHDALRVVEEQTDGTTRPQFMRAIDSHLQKTRPALGAEDRSVMSMAWASFPETAKLLTELVRTDDIVVSGPRADGCTRVRLMGHLNGQRLKELYPDLQERVESLRGLIDLDMKLHDAAGNTLASFWFDSEHMRARLEFVVREGSLVPVRAGKPLVGVAPRFERMHSHMNLQGSAMGMHMYVDDLRIESQYLQLDTEAELATQLTKTPRFRVEGALFGILPVGVLDWFVPGDIPGLATRMFEVGAHGNEGRGMEFNFRFAQGQDAGRSSIGARANIEVLDTALIRLGMSIVADRVIPNDAQRADIYRLANATRDAFARDVERFSKYGRIAL